MWHPEENNLKEERKKKATNSAELSERFTEAVARRIGRVSTNSLMDKVVEVMKGISNSPFAPWIMTEVLPKRFSPPVLDKFDAKSDPVSHLLYFKQRISLENVTEGLTCKLFSMTFTGQALSWFSQLPKGSVQSFEQLDIMFLEQYRNNFPPN